MTKATCPAEYTVKRVHIDDYDYIIEQMERDGWRLFSEEEPQDYSLRLTFERAATEAIRANG